MKPVSDIDITPDTALGLREQVHSRLFQDELVVLDLASGEYYSLDAIGSRVWRELALGRPLREVVRLVGGEYDVDVARLTEDIRDFARELVRRGLMVEALPHPRA